jgi:hypothetical protein
MHRKRLARTASQAGIQLLIGLSIAMTAVAARAADDESIGLTRDPEAISDAELDARLHFLEERLDDGEHRAKYWQWGWASFFSGSVLYGTGRAIASDHAKGRVAHIVSAAESVIGTAHQFFWPLPGRNGADPMRAIPGNSREAKIARLAAGEAELLAIAARTKDRTDWKYHVGNVALNAAGAGAIFAYGHDSDAWVALGTGIAIGEISIWTAPNRGRQDLDDYETRFEMKSASRVHWSIVPMMGGAGLRVTF